MSFLCFLFLRNKKLAQQRKYIKKVFTFIRIKGRKSFRIKFRGNNSRSTVKIKETFRHRITNIPKHKKKTNKQNLHRKSSKK